MKVFVLDQDSGYEGARVIGVYTSRQAALDGLREHFASGRHTVQFEELPGYIVGRYDPISQYTDMYFDVTEYELDRTTQLWSQIVLP